VKTEESDARVTREWADLHLRLGIDAMTHIGEQGEAIRHFRY
jgi:AMP nucleosidase